MPKSDGFQILNQLKRIDKINGAIRTVHIEVEDNYKKDGNRLVSAATYGTALDRGTVPGQKRDYHFSDGNPFMMDDIWNNPKIKKSINGIVSGKRRPSSELDSITEEMAKAAVNNVRTYIAWGGPGHFQEWKGTSSRNLMETGNLFNSIVGVAKRKNGKEIWRGV